jgi:hypothetical protein
MLGSSPIFYVIISADSFTNRIYPRFFRLHDVKKRLESSAMEYEQRVIIKFLTNESGDTHEIRGRLNAQFDEQSCTLRMIQFWTREM